MKNRQSGYPVSLETVFAALAALALLIVNAVLFAYTRVHPAFTAAFSAIIYVAAVSVFLFVKRSASRKRRRTPLPETVNVLAGAVTDLPHPAFICPEGDDIIIWSNKAAAEFIKTKHARFSEIFETLPDLDDNIRLEAEGRRFSPISYSSEGVDKRIYNVFIMHDVTELDRTIDLLCGKESAVAYITVDNLDELLNYEQEDYRSASGDTEKKLRQWANEAGGVLKEYQQDKYIFIFERSNLEGFTKSGFDILDKIRDIRVGQNSIPITVSMGICAANGTPLEREKAAQSALDTALQRGGDQVVLKTDTSVEIFGGKTKIPQKRTKVRARVVANELISHISSSSNVIIMGHKFADFDAFGSCVGLARLSLFCGVPVNIVSDLDDSNLDRCRAWLSGEPEYTGMFIDSDSAMDLISSDTLLIIADVNNKFQFEDKRLFENCDRVAIIDHHRKTADFEKKPIITYIEPAASAASELVAEMLEQVLPGEELRHAEADLMMAGILLDTNQIQRTREPVPSPQPYTSEEEALTLARFRSFSKYSISQG